MSKFVIACPVCHQYVQASTGLFESRRVRCACGNIIDVKTERLASRKCPSCGNQVVFDQADGSDARCPVCQSTLMVGEAVSFRCHRCGCQLNADSTVDEVDCPVCGAVNDVQAEVKKAQVRAEGIPAVIGRSSLRRKDPIGGYNLVTVGKDSITFCERIIKTETRPAWNVVRLHAATVASPGIAGEKKDTVYFRPDFSINNTYPAVREVWQQKDVTDVASQGSIDGELYIYTNTAGMVHALNARNGETVWTYATGNKVFSAPFITSRLVVVTSCDGFVYALDKKDGSVRWRYDTGYPIVACPAVAGGNVYVGSSNGKFYSIRFADGTPDWIADGLDGYIESRPAIDGRRAYIGTWGAMFYAIDRRTGEKVWKFDTGRGRYFSPGACWPVVLPYRKDGKSSEQVIVLSSDYFVRAFNPEDGKILWASDEAKGRESLGFSPDGKTMYIKGIKNNITAVDVSKGSYTPLWNTLMPYESNFIPTRMETTEEYVFIPTEFGVVHAVRTDGSGIAWSHKVSHSAVTSLKNAGDHRLIVMTMDGTVTCLAYP